MVSYSISEQTDKIVNDSLKKVNSRYYNMQGKKLSTRSALVNSYLLSGFDSFVNRVNKKYTNCANIESGAISCYINKAFVEKKKTALEITTILDLFCQKYGLGLTKDLIDDLTNTLEVNLKPKQNEEYEKLLDSFDELENIINEKKYRTISSLILGLGFNNFQLDYVKKEVSFDLGKDPNTLSGIELNELKKILMELI